MSNNVDPTIMNYYRGQAEVGSENVEHTHHKPGVREQKPEQLETPKKPDGVVGFIRKLALDATGVRNPEESV